MTDALKEVLKDNEAGLAEVTKYEADLANSNATTTATQGKLNDAIGSRDKAKNENILFRNKFNVDNSQEINDEFLDTIGAKKTADIAKIETGYQTKIADMAKDFNSKEAAFNATLTSMSMDSAITEATLGAGITDNPIMAQAFRAELHKGAVVKDGVITYMGENDIPVMDNGKPMTVKGKIETMKSDTAYDVFFGKVVKGGTGGTGGAGGGHATTKRSEMTPAQKGAYISKYGSEKYNGLEY